MGERDGAFKGQIEGVVRRADRDLGGAGGGAAQVELFDDVAEPDMQPPSGWDAPSALAGPAPRRGGRPRGALNKRSLDLARYFQARYRDPAAMLGELVSRDAIELWREISAADPEGAPSLVDVIRLQAAVARDLLPYLHAKRPVEVDVGDKRPVFVLPALGETVEVAVEGVLRLDEGIDDLD